MKPAAITSCMEFITNYSGWQAGARNVFRKKLEEMKRIYDEIGILYEELSKVIEILEECKKLKQEIEIKQREIEKLNNNLYYEKSSEENVTVMEMD